MAETSTTGVPSAPRSRAIPEDKINLRLILATGSRSDFVVSPSDTATAVTKYVHENWPKEWMSETKAEIPGHLRLIYLGRFLHNKLTLGGLNLPTGKTTVMHLVIRENVPGEGRTSSSIRRDKGQSADEGSSCNCCNIL
ncbi:ubiquitin-like protein 3 [Oscarella lobularis]|uniref:ubiquitin-like protein 3 n=1 Tax=Oscarella lobularis TaxID=121494 RepID=UPI003313E0A2